METTPVDDSLIETLLSASKLQSEWRALGTVLGIQKERLDYLGKTKMYKDDYARAKRVFDYWKEKPDNATKENLQKALKALEKAGKEIPSLPR